MLIDCDTCSARGLHCGDCVITVLLGTPPHGVSPSGTVELDPDEQIAFARLAEAGLVPPLRLVASAGSAPAGTRASHRRDTRGIA